MMGGVCFLLEGSMIGGADCPKDGAGRFMFRVGKENEAAAEALLGGQLMVQGGRRMGGFSLSPKRFTTRRSCKTGYPSP